MDISLIVPIVQRVHCILDWFRTYTQHQINQFGGEIWTSLMFPPRTTLAKSPKPIRDTAKMNATKNQRQFYP